MMNKTSSWHARLGRIIRNFEDIRVAVEEARVRVCYYIIHMCYVYIHTHSLSGVFFTVTLYMQIYCGVDFFFRISDRNWAWQRK
jgi:hypothetical protein